MENIVSHDGVALKKGMRVARSDNSGFLAMGVITGFKFGLVELKMDSGWKETRGSYCIYAR